MIFFQYVLARIKNSPVPFVLHLDHGDNMGDVMRAVRCGFSSVMIDGSLLPFEENIRVTKEVVDVCHKLGFQLKESSGLSGKLVTVLKAASVRLSIQNPKKQKNISAVRG